MSADNEMPDTGLPSRLNGEDRLRRITSVTDAALAHLTVEDLLQELLARVSELLATDTAAVLLLDPVSGQLIATAAQGIEEEVRQGVRLPLGKGFAGRIAAEKRAVTIEHVDHTNVLNPILADKGIRSLLGVPLVAEGTVIGVLHVGTLKDRRFTDDDIHLLQLVADRVAFAVRARLAQADQIAAIALQRSLLPARLPSMPGLDLAARYVPGQRNRVGGDWYDVFTLPSGALSVVIGDVAGHGLQSAVVMGRLRSALRAYALESDDPADVLGRLDRKLQHFEPGATATVVQAVVEPPWEEIRMSAAGHLPPVLAEPGRSAVPLDVAIDVPLGVDDTIPRRTSKVHLPPDAVLCFYTDGLVEDREQPMATGLAALCEAVTADAAEAVCRTVMAAIVGARSLPDDVTLLAMRRCEKAVA
jgi:phosphoserine phosphatase RsbU/P